VSIDTRTLRPGDVFFAIRGVRMDGHAFVRDALNKGAAAVVVSEGEETPAITVEDTLAALRRAGIVARRRIGANVPVVGVTGSVGKTGTKEMMRLAFGALGSAHASEASYNNHWGVPLSLARMPADTEAAVFEMGMNHAGEIRALTTLVRPTVAVVTAVEAVHLEFFDSVAGIADAKAEIFEGLDEGGAAILPVDNPYTDRLRRAAERYAARIVTFGGTGADVRLVSHADDGATEAEVFGEPVRFQLLHPGVHVARNALTVLAALAVTGRPVAVGAEALSHWTAPRGRGRRVRLRPAGGEALLLDEAYNANPASMEAAIASIARAPATRRVAILGDMLELGPTENDLHRGLAPLLVDARVRIVHTVGNMMTNLRDALPFEMRGRHAETAGDLLEELPEVEPGDVVLVKGSNAVGLSRVVDGIEQRFGLEV
jgi:UDP-N-acetylmuramoyl-tripeptide--D-alanyl-D-alanine ligase